MKIRTGKHISQNNLIPRKQRSIGKNISQNNLIPRKQRGIEKHISQSNLIPRKPLSYDPYSLEELKALEVLSKAVDDYTPTMYQTLQQLWSTQRDTTSEALLKEFLEQGMTTSLHNSVSEVYNGSASEIFTNLFQRSFQQTYLNQAGGRTWSYYPGAYAAQDYAATYFQTWADSMTGSQVQVWEKMWEDFLTNPNYAQDRVFLLGATEELSTYLRGTVGLTYPQMRANFKYYESLKASLKEAHPKWTDAKIQEQALKRQGVRTRKQTRERARTIALTESARMHNTAQHMATLDAQQRGLLGECIKVVSTAENERVCGVCGKLHKQERAMDKVFENGYLFPPFHPRCRCVVLYKEISPPKLTGSERIPEELQEWMVDSQGQILSVANTEISPQSSGNPLTPSVSSGNIIPSGRVKPNGNQEILFLENILKMTDMSVAYSSNLLNRFQQGTDNARAAFLKYVTENTIETGVATKSATGANSFFNLDSKLITMNFAEDLQNLKGVGKTFFHEHGHYIDFFSALGDSLSSDSSNLAAALKTDYQALMGNFQREWTHPTEALFNFCNKLRQKEMYAVSDLCGGLSGNIVKGVAYHKNDYWKKPFALEREAFAHFYEASFDPEKYKRLQFYFPQATKEFEQILEEITK